MAEGRFAKAHQFLDAAETISELADDQADVGDAFVTLCVHAGIAAADVVCCLVLGEHAHGEDHNQAIELIARVRHGGEDLARPLSVLLGLKTRSGYGHGPASADDRKRAHRAAARLVSAAQEQRATA